MCDLLIPCVWLLAFLPSVNILIMTSLYSLSLSLSLSCPLQSMLVYLRYGKRDGLLSVVCLCIFPVHELTFSGKSHSRMFPMAMMYNPLA